MSKVYCHKMVKSVAEEMAGETYDLWAESSDKFYEENRSQKDFVKEKWPMFIEAARRTLAELLGTNIAETLKDQISDALIQDNSLRFGQTTGVQVDQW